jgi:hypothetical protein
LRFYVRKGVLNNIPNLRVLTFIGMLEMSLSLSLSLLIYDIHYIREKIRRKKFHVSSGNAESVTRRQFLSVYLHY